MEDKEKQIEKMEYDISYIDDNGYYYDEDGYQQDAYADCHKIAEELIKKGWIKPDENNLVLSRELLEVNGVKSVDELVIISRPNLMAKLELKEKEVCKETTEKLITKIKQSLCSVETIVGDTHKLQPEIGYSMREVDDLLDELAKEFDIEIKE